MNKSKTPKKILALVLCVMMFISIIPMSVFAAVGNYNKDYVSDTHDVFKHTESTLAPGVEQYINYAYAKDGKQMVYYVATADITRDDVFVQTSYLKQHENGVMGMDKLTNQIAYANQKYSNPEDEHFISEYYNVVAGVNASFYNMTTGQPIGITFIDGVSFGTSSYDNFFAILKDGKTAVIDYAKNLGNYVDENGESTIWQAAAGSQWLVRDGKDVTASASGSYNTQRHSRTCVGITADGKVVMMVLDGRQEPFSCGGSMHELAQIMLEAGCVAAVNLDGGGSTTYASRPEGSDKVEVINRPSDGSERSISSGLIIASTAVPSNTFDRVTMNAEDEYVTVGTSTKVTVAGVSPSGSSAEIPTDIAYTVVNGTYENGVLTATAVGDVVLTATYNGKEVGSVTIHAVVPEKLVFNSSEMTVPFGKTITLALTATYGLNEVKIKASDILFTLENDGIGTIDGFDFTAGDGGVTESSITATFTGTEITATSTIKLGKGSEVIFDFEDGDTSMFDLGYVAYNYVLPDGRVYPVTAANGKVHSGNGAMALDINYGNSLESGYMMTALEYKGGEKKFENATKLGMWIYISDEDVSTWIRYTIYPLVLNDNGEYVRASDSITNTLCDGVASTTGFVNQYQEPGWHYLSIDLSKYKGLDLIGSYILQFYISDRDGKDYGYYYNQHKSYNGRYVMYVDDITVDYSDAVDDREAPVFGDVTYATGSMSDAAVLNGQTVSENVLSFGVKVADNTKKNNFTGLNIATAKAYIDGVETACTYKDGVMSLSDVTLADGMHHVKFSICDNQGNYASVIRTINVQANSGKSTVKVVAHDPTLDKILLGSVWYADIVATDIEKVQSVTVDIDLNNMSKWELDHMEVAAGFTAACSIPDDENIATITIMRTGENTQTGEAVLASLPIRTWELGMGYTYTSGTKKGQPAYTYAQFKSMKEFWPIDISMEIDRGIVTFVDGTTDTFSGEGPQVDTEMYKMAKDMISTDEGKAYYAAWNGGHIHTANALPDKAATCTEAGYTGRTYCEVCNSVVDWGETVPATGHSYALVDGVLKCTECGELFTGTWTDGKEYKDGILVRNYILVDGIYYTYGNGVQGGVYTGLVDIDGVNYFSKLGVLTSGWFDIDGAWYYFMPETKTAADGSVTTTDGITFDFENGKVLHGVWTMNGQYKNYWYGPDRYRNTSLNLAYLEVEIDGNKYFFNSGASLHYGMVVTHDSNDHVNLRCYDCGTDGIAKPFTGVYQDTLYVNAIRQLAYKLVKVGDDYYFVGDNHAVVRNRSVYLGANAVSAGLNAGYYYFGADGKMELKNGIIDDYYYINGIKAAPYYGLVKWEGNFYYVNDGGKIVRNMRKFVNTTNGLTFENGDPIQRTYFDFDADGKMVLKNGIVGDYYYINGALATPYYGLVKWEGNFYYVNDGGKIVRNMRKFVNTTNGLTFENGDPIQRTYFDFDADGKMVLKNGIVGDYYYINGVLATPYYGLVKWEGNFYYVNDGGKIVRNMRKFVNTTNGLTFENGEAIQRTYYDFDADGKMILN